jgi:hypothetical protein
MNLEELQHAWENQPSPYDLLRIEDPETLAKRFQEKSNGFRLLIYWRDIRESGVAFAVALFFFWFVAGTSLLIAGITAACMSFVGVFIIVDRVFQRRRRPEASDSVLNNIRVALVEVEHQIWLLRNMVWWYLGPIYIATIIVMYTILTLPLPWSEVHWSDMPQFDSLFSLVFVGGVFVFVAAVFAGGNVYLYVFNQRAVRDDLEPRRAELVELLESLETPTAENP